jgi:hypothetical protein
LAEWLAGCPPYVRGWTYARVVSYSSPCLERVSLVADDDPPGLVSGRADWGGFYSEETGLGGERIQARY